MASSVAASITPATLIPGLAQEYHASDTPFRYTVSEQASVPELGLPLWSETTNYNRMLRHDMIWGDLGLAPLLTYNSQFTTSVAVNASSCPRPQSRHLNFRPLDTLGTLVAGKLSVQRVGGE